MKNLWISVAIAVSLAVLPALVSAGPKWKLQDEHLNWTPKSAWSSVATSTHNYTGYYAYGFSIWAEGDDVSFTTHYTTKTFTSGVISVSSSTVIKVPEGMSLSYDFATIVKDPKIVTHGFSTSATYYLFISLGQPKRR